MNSISPSQFTHDINWLLTSPSLILQSQSKTEVINNLSKWVSLGCEPINDLQLAKEDFETISQCYQRMHRLGDYAEFLLKWWLNQQNGIEFLDHGIQVKSANGQTAGELDFLFQIADKRVHLELAVKFYLMKDDNKELSSFVGPNSRDRFDLKYDKMIFRQSQWLQDELKIKNHVFKSTLGEEITQSAWHSAVLIKGMLFYHWQKNAQSITLPKEVNPNCLTGVWAYKQEFSSFLDQKPQITHWLPLVRLQWLSPYVGLAHLRKWTSNEIKQKVDESNKPILLIGLNSDGSKNSFQEGLRLMIVPDSWPR